MTTLQKRTRAGRLGGVAVATVALVSFEGCNLERSTIPPLFGPAELVLSLLLTASPDLVIANEGIDVSGQSTITVNFRDENGNPVSGRGIVFELLNDRDALADRGRLSSAVTSTDGNGVASVTYFAPACEDATSTSSTLVTSSVLVTARPIGNDLSGQALRTVRIGIRSPQAPPDTQPACLLMVQSPSLLLPTVQPTPDPTPTPTPTPEPTPTPTPDPGD